MSKPKFLAREFGAGEIAEFFHALRPSSQLDSCEYLFGGVSTTTVKIHYEGKTCILKILFPNMFVNSIDICRFIHDSDPEIPITFPESELVLVELRNDPTPKTKFPVVLMSFIPDAKPANLVESKAPVLRQLGKILAQIHSIQPRAGLVSYRDGGAVDVFKHAQGQFVEQVASIGNEEFTNMYKNELKNSFQNLHMFPIGIIHGDPYLDNLLVSNNGGDFSSLVDFEDACIGPVMFDVGCAIAGGCMDETGMDWEGVAAFLEGYESVRILNEMERSSIVQFTRIGIMCSCAFRFMTLANTPHSDAYMPLKQLLVYMDTNYEAIKRKLEEILEDDI